MRGKRGIWVRRCSRKMIGLIGRLGWIWDWWEVETGEGSRLEWGGRSWWWLGRNVWGLRIREVGGWIGKIGG